MGGCRMANLTEKADKKVMPTSGYSVINGKKVKKVNPSVITFFAGSVFLLFCTVIALKVATDKKNEIASITSTSAQSAKELEAREAFLTTRKAYLEKLSRTDYSTNLRTAIAQPGDSIQVGWRQLAAADWAQSIKSDLKDLRNTRNHPLYRVHETPALEVLKLQSMTMLSEIAAGNTDFYFGYRRTDGTKVEEKLSTGGAAYLVLGKLEAIDLANSLISIPEVNYSMMLADISRVNESYVLSLRSLLQAQGYTDPVERLRDAAKTADEIQFMQELNRQKVHEIQLKPIAPEPKLVERGGS